MFVNTNIFDPLEQFDIINYCTWSSNISGLMLFLFLIFIFFSRNLSDFYLMSYKNYFIKKLFDFVRVIVKSNIRIKKRYMFFLILLIFIYILFSNSIGLIPYTFTITSSLIVTFFIASMFFLGINIISAFTNGWNSLNIFMAKGVPLVIIPFLVPIELISYLSRVVSLSVRLFANMMSGHTLLKILGGFLWAFLSQIAKGGVSFGFLILSILPWLVIMAILVLECAVAFLQAYVFTVLIAIYLNDGVNSH